MKAIVVATVLTFAGWVSAGEDAVGTFATFSWDAVTQDVTGAPETIWKYELAAFPAGADLSSVVISDAVAKIEIEGTQTTADASFMIAVPSGTRIRLGARAYDLAGNISDWSNPKDIKLDFGKPLPPGQLKKIWPLIGAGAAAIVGAAAVVLRRRKRG